MIESIKSTGTSIVMQQFNNEPILSENKPSDFAQSVDLEQYVGKIVSATLDSTGDLNKIEL